MLEVQKGTALLQVPAAKEDKIIRCTDWFGGPDADAKMDARRYAQEEKQRKIELEHHKEGLRRITKLRKQSYLVWQKKLKEEKE